MSAKDLLPAKKGEKRNPVGRPKDPVELHMIKRMSKGELELLMTKLLALNKEELKVVQENGNGMEMAMASIILRAIDFGDSYRLQFFLERLFGKVSDKLEVDSSENLVEVLNRIKNYGK